MNMKFILMTVFFTILHIQLAAQGFSDRSTYYSYGTKMYAEAFYQPIADNDSLEITIMFKIVHHAMSFVKSTSIDRESYFFATPSVEITLRDTLGIIRNRQRWKDTLKLSRYEDTESKDKFSAGFIQFNMLPGIYNTSLSLLDSYDKESHKVELSLSIIDFSNKPIISQPIFVSKSAGITDYKYDPFILGGNVAFSSANSVVLIPLSYANDYSNYNFTLESKPTTDLLYYADDFKLSGRMELIQSDGIIVKENMIDRSAQLNISDYTYDMFDLKFGILRLVLPEQSLLPGNYRLTVYQDDLRDSTHFDFMVLWHDMPLSLRDLEYAIDATFYLLTDEQFEEMKKGNNKEMRTKFLEFWKSKDPTPLTPFNEAITQYFNRVDYAFFNFQSMTQRDGAKTDKGKIHILFGTPDNVRKELIDGKSHDIWQYSSLGKTFYFESQTKGIFKLTKIDE